MSTLCGYSFWPTKNYSQFPICSKHKHLLPVFPCILESLSQFVCGINLSFYIFSCICNIPNLELLFVFLHVMKCYIHICSDITLIPYLYHSMYHARIGGIKYGKILWHKPEIAQHCCRDKKYENKNGNLSFHPAYDFCQLQM